EVSGEFREERVGLFPDDGLTELPDPAENGEVGIDGEVGPGIVRHQPEAQSRSDPAAEATIIGLGPHARPPRVPVPLLDGANPLERETNGPDLDLETAPVDSSVRGLNGLDTRNAASDPRDLHHELPQALSLDWDHAFLGEGHGLACARRAASHAWPSARPTIT